MLNKRTHLFLLIILLSPLLWSGAGGEAFAQNTDSLQTLFKNSKEDTTKVNLTNDISRQLINNGDYKTALSFALQAKELAQKLSYKKGEASALSLIASAYMNKGDYPEALQYNLASLKIREELKDKKGITNIYHDIGQIYDSQGISDKALDYYERCLKLREQLNDKKGIANLYNDMGIVYDVTGNYDKALKYYRLGLKIREDIKDSSGLCDSYVNIGIVYKEQNKYDEALKYYQASLPLYQKMNYTRGIIAYYSSSGEIYRLKGNFALAQTMFNKAIELAHQIASKSDIKDVYQQLTLLDSTKGNYKFAFQDYKSYISYRDSLNNEESTKKSLEEQFNYDLDKKEAIAKAEQDKKDAIAAADSRRQQFVIYSVVGILLIILVFSIFLYRRFKITEKQKHIIEKQKVLVELHQKEIVDSITYAKRLQQAILPSIDEIKQYFPESFLYYQPKDIVAGDFYWMHTTKEAVFIAAADCTGHGVPGAMVSVVCSNALNRAVKEFNLSDTGAILDKTRELVIETFEKSDKDVKDGMDISLFRIAKHSAKPLKNENDELINTATKEIQWSGANNSLWYILNKELIEVKANKQPIGKYGDELPFTTNKFKFDSQVSFYLFSDGYADQFSPNDKKLMKKKFKDIVLNIQHLSMPEQGMALDKFHTDWKGGMEQTDDVLVIGLKI
ncbi:MAG TPA: tetratricopeptide repeat protein [Bacteroidia bacterium]